MRERENHSAVRQHFRDQAEHCRRLGSPFTAMLVETAAARLNEESAVGRARSRQGCDRHPIDPGNAQDRLRLRAYIWPDQRGRLQRLDAALQHAALQPTRVERADAADWVEARLADRVAGVTTVLYHSIVWQYLPRASQRRIEAALDRAGADAGIDSPLAWLRMEPSPDGGKAELLLTTWPSGSTERLAHADYHGRWVEWLGPGAR